MILQSQIHSACSSDAGSTDIVGAQVNSLLFLITLTMSSVYTGEKEFNYFAIVIVKHDHHNLNLPDPPSGVLLMARKERNLVFSDPLLLHQCYADRLDSHTPCLVTVSVLPPCVLLPSFWSLQDQNSLEQG